jgi:hypothetical protein
MEQIPMRYQNSEVKFYSLQRNMSGHPVIVPAHSSLPEKRIHNQFAKFNAHRSIIESIGGECL